MNKPSQQTVSITPALSETLLSPAQKKFNELIGKIETRRARLLEWETTNSEFQQKYVEQMLPLEQELRDVDLKTVHCLHEIWPQKGLTKGERLTLSEIIADMAYSLLQQSDDTELKLIYNQHSGSDFDDDVRAELGDMKEMLEEMLDVDLGEEMDSAPPEEIMEKMAAMLDEKEREHMAAEQAREERRASRKKSAQQLATEAKLDKERNELSQSIREVYRKLASALHPDREPDPTERERKTALMQQINQAYEKNDLLKLLELQLTLEHIDQNAINGIGDERLKHYNKILKEQLGELEREILHVEHQFRHSFGLSPRARVSPSTIVRNLNKDLGLMRQECKYRRIALASFGDLKEVKAWLKFSRQQRTEAWDDDQMF